MSKQELKAWHLFKARRYPLGDDPPGMIVDRIGGEKETYMLYRLDTDSMGRSQKVNQFGNKVTARSGPGWHSHEDWGTFKVKWPGAAAREQCEWQNYLQEVRAARSIQAGGDQEDRAHVVRQNSEANQAEALRCVQLEDGARLPQRATSGSAGMDLCAVHATTVEPQSVAVLSLGMKMGIPKGQQGFVFSRSGLAVKHMVVVGCGVIDQDYRGDVKVVLFNLGKEPFQVVEGMKVAQLVLLPNSNSESRWAVELDDTVRSDQGFGSTGDVDAIEDSVLDVIYRFSGLHNDGSGTPEQQAARRTKQREHIKRQQAEGNH